MTMDFGLVKFSNFLIQNTVSLLFVCVKNIF